MALWPHPDFDHHATHIRIPLHRLFYYLFFDPSVFVVLQRKNLSQVLRLVCLVCLVSAAIIASSVVIAVHSSAQRWKGWIKEEIGELSVSPTGTVSWNRPKELPYTGRFGSWIITYSDRHSFPQEKLVAERAACGIWITPDDCLLWVKLPPPSWGDYPGETVLQPFDLVQIGRLFLPIMIGETTFTANSADVCRYIDRVLLTFYLLVLLAKIVMVIGTVMLLPVISSVLMIVMPYVIRNRDFRMPFPRIAVLYLYTSIPPIIIATVYACLRFEHLNFFIVFFLAFLGYHFYVMRVLRNMTNNPSTPADPWTRNGGDDTINGSVDDDEDDKQ